MSRRKKRGGAKQKKSGRNVTDKQGIVRVTVALEDQTGKPVKKNERRSFRVNSATVTAVAEAIEAKIFVRPDLYQLKGKQ
jgi:hypothetical protein